MVTVELDQLPGNVKTLAKSAVGVGWSIWATRAESPVTCAHCDTVVGWVDCPTGGWWAHGEHPADGHDAAPSRLTTLAVRFAHDDYRAYGAWTLGTTPKGKPSVKWRAGASRSGRFFGNLEALRAYLGVAK